MPCLPLPPCILLPALLASPAVPPAQITLTTPFPVHLGSVGPRETKEVVFGIKSLARHPFRLRVMDLSPGLSLDERQLDSPLQPGEVRRLRVRVDPTGMEGPIRGAMRLGTDDPAQPFYILRYDMTVRPAVEVDATRQDLGAVAPYESPSAVYRFRREDGEPLRLTLEPPLPPYLQATVSPTGGGAEVQVTLRPALLPPGELSGLEILRVATHVRRHPRYTLTLAWHLALPVRPSPSRLVFDDLDTLELPLELASRDGRPFRITQASIAGRGFALAAPPGPAAPRQVLRIRRTGNEPSALLVLRIAGQDAPLRVPLLFLDPHAPAPGTTGR